MTKELKKIVEQHELERLRREIEALKADRDRFLNALKSIKKIENTEWPDRIFVAQHIAREALAKGETNEHS